ncbi:hypothetical protein Acor_83260 [Acrocarpospora corrugata]|uniref:Uncharacterized protein n=2 Tax=Acrocarpospora corrugata TaxID=35763 RepID=A0A5M3WB36_9ACTN|nr:hypothetical protein Acor_83260 [Acrocarpospora corrugata]
MVSLMAATLITVVASRVLKIGDSLGDVAAVTPFYAAFLVIMAFAGLAVTCLFRLDAGAGRAIVFSALRRVEERKRTLSPVLQLTGILVSPT